MVKVFINNLRFVFFSTISVIFLISLQMSNSGQTNNTSYIHAAMAAYPGPTNESPHLFACIRTIINNDAASRRASPLFRR